MISVRERSSAVVDTDSHTRTSFERLFNHSQGPLSQSPGAYTPDRMGGWQTLVRYSNVYVDPSSWKSLADLWSLTESLRRASRVQGSGLSFTTSSRDHRDHWVRAQLDMYS